VGDESITIYFADSTAAGFSTLVSGLEAASAPELTLTGTQQDLSSDLNLPIDDSADVCINCVATVPDSASTGALLAMGLAGMAGVVLLYRRMPRARA
jgi:hypothetical protein